MGLRKYVKQKRKRKESIKQDEKRVMEMMAKERKNNSKDEHPAKEDEIPIEIKILLEREGRPLSEEEWESLKQLIENQKTDDGKINKDTIRDRLMNMEIYRLIIEHSYKKRRFDLQLQFIMTLSLFIIFLCSISSFTTGSANPIQFLIQVTEYIDGNMSVMTDVEEEEVDEANEVDFEVYQVDYMTEDYVLMKEEKYNNAYSMKYYYDKNHFIVIEQSPMDYGKYISLTDDTNYQTILLDGMEYLYSYNPKRAVSFLYLQKENTIIFIRGTIEKNEILHVAKDLYKK